MKNETYCWLVLLGVFFFFFQLSCESYMVMDVVVQNPQKSSGYDQCTTMTKNMWVVTPRCAAAAVVSAVVLRRPTKEYTHRYSMMHRRLTTAGIEVAPHYHQLLVQHDNIITRISRCWGGGWMWCRHGRVRSFNTFCLMCRGVRHCPNHGFSLALIHVLSVLPWLSALNIMAVPNSKYLYWC